MTPGRELDALIAEKVMGWKDIHLEMGTAPDGRVYVDIPEYSTQISYAWDVVEKAKGSFQLQLRFLFDPYKTTTFWNCEFCIENEVFISDGETAPHAICLAALKAVQSA